MAQPNNDNVDISFMKGYTPEPGGEDDGVDISFMQGLQQPSGMQVLDATTQSSTTGEAKAVRGFWDTLKDPIKNIKEESIPAHLIEYFTTSREEQDKKDQAEKDSVISSIPAVMHLKQKIDNYDYIAQQRDLTDEEIDTKFKLIDAYGTLYQEMETAYDKGEFKQGFSLTGLKEAVKNDPGGVLAEFINGLAADPEFALIPAGWEGAAAKAGAVTAKYGKTVEKIAATTAGLSSTALLGGGAAAIDEASRQLATTGRLDAEGIKSAATLGAIAAPILVGSGKMASEVIHSAKVKAANTQIDRFENQIGEYRSQGLNQQTAVDRAAYDLGLKEKQVAKYTVIAGRKVKVNNKNPTLNDKTLTDKVTEKLADSLAGRAVAALGDAADNILGAVSTRVGNISPKIMHELRRLDHTTHVDSLRLKTQIKPFVTLLRKIPSAYRDRVKAALLNGDREAFDAIVNKANLSDLKANYTTAVKPALDEIFGMMENVGHKPEAVDFFFPRIVKDYNKLSSLMNKNQKSILQKALDDAAKKKGDKLTPGEQSDVINKYMRKPEFNGIQFNLSTVKGRKIKKISKKWLDAYYNPDESIELYINNTIHNVHKRQFFGYGKADPANADLDIDSSVQSILQKEISKGNMTLDDAMKLRPLLFARFSGGEKQSARWILHAKNIFYTSTIGNPLSALVQFGDIGTAAYMHGFGNALKATFFKKEVKLSDIGINVAAQEFESTISTARFLNKMLRVSGFRWIDALGKEVHINAALNKYRGMVKTPKGIAKIQAKYKQAFSDAEMNRLLSDLANKRVSEPVKYLLWSELSDAQPIALSEMPTAYLNHPNGRIFYMLKTFTIKQLDLIRRDAIQKIFKGDKVEGTKNLMGLVGAMTLANVSVAEIKDWILGRKEDLSDKIIPNILKNFGLSDYILKDAKKRGVSAAALEIVMPPLNIVDSAVEDMANLGHQFKSLRYVPWIGSFAYNWFGGGLEKWSEKKQQEEWAYPQEEDQSM